MTQERGEFWQYTPSLYSTYLTWYNNPKLSEEVYGMQINEK